MTAQTIKRFYTQVSVEPQDEHFVVALDGRVAKTVGRYPLGSVSKLLAEAIAEEWDAQSERIDLQSMPFTRLQGFVLDGAEQGATECRQTVLNFLGSDLLCYRAEDDELASRQMTTWQPVLDRVGQDHGGEFAVTTGILAVDQPASLLSSVETHLKTLSVGEVLSLRLMTESSGSAVLALAVHQGHLSAEEAFAASQLDETHQNEKWGEDAEAAARVAVMKSEFLAIHRFMELGRSG